MKNRINILVLGLDESTERANWGSFRTDTMILVTVDFETKNVHMISVPRDSYVKISNEEGHPIGQYGKVNSAFPTGGGAQKKGYGYAMGTVSYLLGGIPIQYYVGFNMNVVKDVVNAMGGVDYNVDVQVKMNGRELVPGQQHLDGQAVLDYCRQRKGSSDIARVDRQQKMLMAIFSQLKSTNQIWNIPSIYKAVESNIQTNLNFNQICALAWMAKDMNTDQLQRYTLDGEFMNINSTSYWGLHTSTIQSKIKEIFNFDLRVDGDMSAATVRKAVEEAQALIAGELSSAQGAIRTANRIISEFGAWIDANTISRLETYKAQVEDAMDAGDKALLDAYTAPLRDLNNQILQKLREAGHNVGGEAGGSSAGTQSPQTPDTEPPSDTQQPPYGDPASEIPYIPEEPVG
jgi:LCP family protein required for cell wall assembly